MENKRKRISSLSIAIGAWVYLILTLYILGWVPASNTLARVLGLLFSVAGLVLVSIIFNRAVRNDF